MRRVAALSDGPLFAAAQFALASHYERTGDLDQARACLREIVIQTDNPPTLRQAQDRLAALGAE
jgi:FimV-like protein